MKNRKFFKKLGKILKEIQSIKCTEESSYKSLRKDFFKIMRKHNIKQGTYLKNGNRIIDTSQWTVFNSLFQMHISNKFQLISLLDEKPKNLKGYKFKNNDNTI